MIRAESQSLTWYLVYKPVFGERRWGSLPFETNRHLEARSLPSGVLLWPLLAYRVLLFASFLLYYYIEVSACVYVMGCNIARPFVRASLIILLNECCNRRP